MNAFELSFLLLFGSSCKNTKVLENRHMNIYNKGERFVDLI